MRNSVHRERILEAAAKLFADNGYHRTGVADLERAVSLGRGALYYHIGDKEALLHQISLDAIGNMVEFAEELLSQDLSADEKLHRIIAGLMQLIATRKPEVTVFYREYPWLAGERREEVMAARARFETAWNDVFVEGERTGVFHPTTAVVRRGMLGMVNYTHLWFQPEGDVTADEIAEQYTTTILAGIAVKPPQRSDAG